MKSGHLATAALVAASAACAQTVINLPDSLYNPGDTVAWVRRVTAYCEGPAWNPATGEVTFSQIGSPGSATNRPDWPLWKIKPGQDTGVIFYNKGQSNGQMLDPSGRLAVIQRAHVIRFNPDGKVDTVIASGANGVSFDANNNTDGGAGNDLSFASSGAFYFTNLASGIFHVNAAGQLSQVYSASSSANGIDWIEEQGRLYVHEGSNIQRFDVQPDGSLTNRTVWASQSGMGADGGCVDSRGNHWVGDYSNGLVRVFNAAGQSIGTITMRSVSGAYNARSGNAGNADNCAFGGEDLKTLYITGDGGLYSLRVKIPGRADPKATALRAPAPKAAGSAETAENRDVRGRLLAPAEKIPSLKIPGKTAR
jgi:gluconolactonase